MSHPEHGHGPDIVQANAVAEGSTSPIAFLGTIIQVLLISATQFTQEQVLQWQHAAKGESAGH